MLGERKPPPKKKKKNKDNEDYDDEEDEEEEEEEETPKKRDRWVFLIGSNISGTNISLRTNLPCRASGIWFLHNFIIFIISGLPEISLNIC